jgi:hypothetical protein
MNQSKIDICFPIDIMLNIDLFSFNIDFHAAGCSLNGLPTLPPGHPA